MRRTEKHKRRGEDGEENYKSKGEKERYKVENKTEGNKRGTS